MRVKIESWFSVARWEWDVPDPQCVICLLPFEAPCPSCKNPGDDCAPVESECSHFFHLHCISKWTSEGNEKCPCCRAAFRIKTSSSLVEQEDVDPESHDHPRASAHGDFRKVEAVVSEPKEQSRRHEKESEQQHSLGRGSLRRGKCKQVQREDERLFTRVAERLDLDFHQLTFCSDEGVACAGSHAEVDHHNDEQHHWEGSESQTAEGHLRHILGNRQRQYVLGSIDRLQHIGDSSNAHRHDNKEGGRESMRLCGFRGLFSHLPLVVTQLE